MFPVASPKTAMCNFYFYYRKTAMPNLFIKSAKGNTHKNNIIDGRPVVFGIYFTSKKQPRIFDLPHEHN